MLTQKDAVEFVRAYVKKDGSKFEVTGGGTPTLPGSIDVVITCRWMGEKSSTLIVSHPENTLDKGGSDFLRGAVDQAVAVMSAELAERVRIKQSAKAAFN